MLRPHVETWRLWRAACLRRKLGRCPQRPAARRWWRTHRAGPQEGRRACAKLWATLLLSPMAPIPTSLPRSPRSASSTTRPASSAMVSCISCENAAWLTLIPFQAVVSVKSLYIFLRIVWWFVSMRMRPLPGLLTLHFRGVIVSLKSLLWMLLRKSLSAIVSIYEKGWRALIPCRAVLSKDTCLNASKDLLRICSYLLPSSSCYNAHREVDRQLSPVDRAVVFWGNSSSNALRIYGWLNMWIHG